MDEEGIQVVTPSHLTELEARWTVRYDTLDTQFRAVLEAIQAEREAIARIAVESANHANQALNMVVQTQAERDQHILDVVYGKFKDFFHESLQRYLDFNRPDYDRTLRDWAHQKFTAWFNRA